MVIDGFILHNRDLLRDKGRTTTTGQCHVIRAPKLSSNSGVSAVLPCLWIARYFRQHFLGCLSQLSYVVGDQSTGSRKQPDHPSSAAPGRDRNCSVMPGICRDVRWRRTSAAISAALTHMETPNVKRRNRFLTRRIGNPSCVGVKSDFPGDYGTPAACQILNRRQRPSPGP
jgi:hypothetical protein